MIGEEGGEYDFSQFEGEIAAWEEGLIERDSSGWKKRPNTNRWEKKDFPKQYGKGDKDKKVEIQAFPFDPNLADRATFIKLGLPERVVNTLLNFRDKGGRFYKKEDLKKIYGMRTEWYEQLTPYIQIAPKPQKTSDAAPSKFAHDIPREYDTPNTRLPKEEYSPVSVDVNTASEQQLQQIRGIGPYYSKRIIRFREALGGYHSLSQVAEVRGLPDSTYQAIKEQLTLGDSELQRININTVSADELKAHPYVKWKTAHAIIKYRETHGTFNDISDLKKVYALSPELYTKLSPYLSVSD
jgi:competence ComEA-like helix-hairpin-helix protein